ncbi:hypothetical protein SAMN06265182_1257 [Persephonella hydrogeniphila]|uniref:Uncharacterized protein n=1 Tax=Persephonella hydrogeniphila TaxID=198703 RepID=A0A285NK89_9AQUI|nr:hypothetical protein [Persephonella hydrogeniphila]SNZ08296.1 hypothetical protein SAMN06265182_1257 [Persephonella hydrogeniphila]
MTEWQVAISIGQLIGTVGALVWFTRSLKSDLSTLQNTHNKKIEDLQKEHYKFREEVADKYLKRDEWLAYHNKTEAKMEREFEEIKKLIMELRNGKS